MALAWPTVQRILITLMVLSFLVAILGAVGELLDWWNDTGEVMMTTGTIIGAFVGTLTLIGGASQDQVDTVHETVEDNNALLRESNAKLETLDEIQWELDRQTGVLTQIRDRL